MCLVLLSNIRHIDTDNDKIYTRIASGLYALHALAGLLSASGLFAKLNRFRAYNSNLSDQSTVSPFHTIV
jgi:hypothetical protein